MSINPVKSNDTFGYNARSEVTAANVSGVPSTYGYDEIGNSTNWTANSLNQYTEFTHDADGNMTQCGDWTYTYDAESGLYYYGYRFYHPPNRRWLNRDPIEEKGSVNIYAFCANNPIANYDSDGRAYFAVRKLKNCPLIVKWSWFVSNPFAKVAVDVAADYLNVEILHEQLFFEDGGKDLENVGWGTDKDGKETYLRNEPKDGYTARDGGYDDCIMRLAVGKVNPDHYQLTWIGKKTKCNCQDYASALRAKYRELENDLGEPWGQTPQNLEVKEVKL